jgi:hypothetical protein
MKTRVIRTRFWEDDVVQSVSSDSRLIWIFLLSNKDIGMTNYFKMPDMFISFYTALDIKTVSKCKQELEKTGKIFFKDNWIFIPKLESLNNYANSPKNIIAYSNEFETIPDEIIQYFRTLYSTMDSSIDSSRHSNEKSETSNKKSEIRNQQSTIRNKKSKKDLLGEGLEYEF